MNLLDLGAEVLNVTSRVGSAPIERDLPYGPRERDRLDIYHPRRRRPNTPALVFFYGGAWVKGSRQMYEFVGRAFSRRGYKTIIPDYRLLSQGASGSALVDGARALEWMASQEDEVVLLGHSAGAELAGSLAYAERWNVARPVVRAFVGLAGPYRYIGGIRRHSLPPAFLLSAGRDRLISQLEVAEFAARLRAHGGSVEERSYPRASHATLIGAVAPPSSPRWTGVGRRR